MAVPQSFPAKIYQILENESPDIIQWNENGVSFRIVDHGRFEREIVPKYFRHNQISSVQRQLNLYGFKCISRGEFKRSFFHPKFRRGDWETVRKLTRYAPVKKNSPPSTDGMFSSTPSEPGAITDEKKRDERQMHPSMYNPYFHPIPGGNMNMNMNGGQPDAAAFNRNFMMGPANSAWLESWDRQENASSMNARMMSLPPHFAYAMMPMHAAAAMHHMNGRLPPALQGTGSSNNLVRVDPTRQSDLSNRLGFKLGPDGSVIPSDGSMPQTDSNSNHSSTEHAAESAQMGIPHSNSLEQLQTSENRLVQSSPRHSFHHDHAYPHNHGHGHHHHHTAPTNNVDYDLMMEFGMFDGSDLYHTAHLCAPTSSSSSSANMSVNGTGAGHGFPQVGHNAHAMRLPTLTHEVPMLCVNPLEQHGALVSAAAALRTPSVVEKPAEASHAHASLEVEVTAHTPGAEEPAVCEHAACSLTITSSSIELEDTATTTATTTITTGTVPTTKGAAVDMACNTMLTYSKIHDALVYYRISDI